MLPDLCDADVNTARGESPLQRPTRHDLKQFLHGSLDVPSQRSRAVRIPELPHSVIYRLGYWTAASNSERRPVCSPANPSIHDKQSFARADAYPWPWTGYSDKPTEMPLAGYSALLAAYVAIFGTLSKIVWSRRRQPEQVSVRDALLFGVATHKIGRILTKDRVTSPLRAPFTEYQKSTGGGEVEERSRGEGLRRATGDLLTCQWCIAPWVAASLYMTFLISPPAARLIAAPSTSVAVSDFLQHLYSGVKRVSQ